MSVQSCSTDSQNVVTNGLPGDLQISNNRGPPCYIIQAAVKFS